MCWWWSTPIVSQRSSASFRLGEPTDRKGYAMKKTAAEPYRDIDFTHAKRGPVVPPEPGKTKISIRLDNRVLDYFRSIVEQAGGGNYQTLKYLNISFFIVLPRRFKGTEQEKVKLL